MELDTAPANEFASPALRALLYRIVDYAGLFPPAGLQLPEAIENYAEYRQSPQEWMLGRFVLPVARVDELDAHSGLFRTAPPFLLAALGDASDTSSIFLERFQEDAGTLQALHERHDDRVYANVLEAKLPRDLLDGKRQTLMDFFDEIHRVLIRMGLSKLDLFLEVPSDRYLRERLSTILPSIAEFNGKQQTPLRSELGYKIRCGGSDAEDVPSPEDVARVIIACHRYGVRFKATAGLHHPLRHYNTEIEGGMHGFLNVFGAACFAHADKISADQLLELITEEDPENFRFDNEAIRWRDLHVPINQVIDARMSFAMSFGSCSFAEPRQDLESMGLL